jgi:hypothetical protein
MLLKRRVEKSRSGLRYLSRHKQIRTMRVRQALTLGQITWCGMLTREPVTTV